MSKASWRWASSPRASATEASARSSTESGVAGLGEQGEGAREEQVAGGRPPLPARGGDDGRPAAPQRRGVEDVVVDQGRHVDELDRRRRPDRGRRRRSGRRRAGRASVAGACRRRPGSSPRVGDEQLAVAEHLLAQQVLDLAQTRRQPAARGVENRGDRRRYGGAAGHPAMPLWIAMMPPARIVQRISLEAGGASILSASRSGLGKVRTDSAR